MAYVAGELLPDLLTELPAPRRLQRLALHPTCSSTQLGLLDPALMAVARAVADEVYVPDSWAAAASPGPWAAAPGADGLRHAGAGRADRGGRAVRRLRLVQPHVRAGHDARDREQYQHVLELLEVATRAT